MSAGNLFSLSDQAAPTDKRARLQAEADAALAEAEYEFYAMRAQLQAALDVPLRHRAVKASVESTPEAVCVVDKANAA
ncbi:MAG: hypothetical protein K8F92_09285 [Hyphomicrobium sp.]|uniref:hypothetical protein n=1 Tax=Hyphomicrobium sp. TaxID=82 RepID=UPI00132909AE|nr:hypothetical protein [Hyphomicrobium sp.]KAB2940822.1 MAG: hypothetical protein F9K20_12045 [Hyphomicrobium sp.]MBZ0209832.1 hypothetical protein [Hyphomicrobium sp.]